LANLFFLAPKKIAYMPADLLIVECEATRNAIAKLFKRNLEFTAAAPFSVLCLISVKRGISRKPRKVSLKSLRALGRY
jgi:hypothetical protein